MDPLLSNDIFAKAHFLLRKRMHAELLKLLINSKGKLRAAAKLDPNHAWYLVGDSMFREGNYKSAQAAFFRAHAIDNADDQAALAVGNCFFEQGDLISAEKWMRKSYEISGNVGAGYNMANVIYDQGDYRTAIAIYKSLKPKSTAIAAMIKTNLELAKKNLKRNKSARCQRDEKPRL